MPSSTQLPFTDIAARAQALLFAEGDSLTFKKLCQLLGCDDATLKQALDALAENLTGSGLALVRTGSEAALAVSPETRDTVAAALQRDQSREIGDAGLEILGIVLYEGPSTRAEIDYVRGVNSSSTLRLLLSRGLIERVGNPEDGREYLYRPSIELLAHLGVTDANKLPEYGTIAEELKIFKTKAKNDVFQTSTEEKSA
jgi:segregation and condensation protein B